MRAGKITPFISIMLKDAGRRGIWNAAKRPAHALRQVKAMEKSSCEPRFQAILLVKSHLPSRVDSPAKGRPRRFLLLKSRTNVVFILGKLWYKHGYSLIFLASDAEKNTGTPTDALHVHQGHLRQLD
jgi:G:T-mismatch repair DNA endonuclease (very short patch repair protein)